jgi:arylsulfatase
MTDRTVRADGLTPALEPDFPGTIGRTVADSVPHWPARRRSGRPNVLLIVLDDVGFSQLGCYGSSIATPAMDELARNGLQYTNFHVAALCSPTRACLLTGRNHHAVGVGFLADYDTGYPGYRGEVTPAAATIAEVLRDAGYGTYACGKWHLTPPQHMTPAGPFRSWPTQRGFDRYYGFLWGEDDQYAPELWYDQHRVDPSPGPDYHLTEDLVTRAREFLSDHLTARPDDPFFLYVPLGACHAPHQAPVRYRQRYRGRFDHGWDVERQRVLDSQIAAGLVPEGTRLPPANPGVAAWADLDQDHREVYARFQEAFAAFMTHTDDQIAALLEFLRHNDTLDDTVVMLMSDNGASGEGGADGSANEYRYFLGLPDSFDETLDAIDDIGSERTHNHYPSGWAQAGNTPGRYYKKYTYAGGVHAPLIVHWPAGLQGASGVRRQFHHVVDVGPTIADLAGVSFPEQYRGLDQLPVHGTSMRYTFTEPDADSTRRRQYFETAGYRGIVDGGYKAIAVHEPGDDFAADRWELYDLAADPAECHDLAGQLPDVADNLQRLWWEEAAANGVLPLDDRMGGRVTTVDPASDGRRYVMLPGSRIMSTVVGPNFAARPFRITAELDEAPAADGVLLAYGRRAAGFAFYLHGGTLTMDYNLAGRHTLVRSAGPVPTSARALQMDVRDGAGGPEIVLLADGAELASAEIPQLMPAGLGCLSLQCGHNAPSAVSPDYRAPFRYPDGLRRVLIELGPRVADAADLAEQECAAALARQ